MPDHKANSDALFKNLVSRDIKLVSGEKGTLLYSVDLPQDSQWQFAFQESGASGGTGTLHIEYASMISILDTDISFGKYGGDIITGFGSVKIFGSALTDGDVQLDSFFTTQSLSIDVGALQLTIGTTGNDFVNVNNEYEGWTPFPFNTFSLVSPNAFDIRFVSGGGTVIFQKNGVTDEYSKTFPVFPFAKIQVKPSVDPQTFNILYTRKD